MPSFEGGGVEKNKNDCKLFCIEKCKISLITTSKKVRGKFKKYRFYKPKERILG